MKTRSSTLILGILTAACVAGTAAADGTYKVTQTSKDEYRVGVKYRTEVETGQLTHARLFVVAKAGWKVNGKFPFKVEITGADGVSLGKTVLKKDDATVMNEHKAVFKIPYKATSDGTHTLKAKVKMSVCKGTQQCLFPTETLKWTVTAKGD